MITYLQIFGIGFSFGVFGPCFLVCTPVLITYIAGTKRTFGEAVKDILVFLSGRFLAYIFLGALAGLSGALIREFAGSQLSYAFRQLAGAVTIFFAGIILMSKDHTACACHGPNNRLLNFGSIFLFGLFIGIVPCAPLLALLFDISLMSKGIFDGALYAAAFGIGTFLSGLIMVSIIAGLVTRIPAAFVRSKWLNIIFKIACALLLAGLGASLMFNL